MTETVKELIPYLDKLANKLDSSAPTLWSLQIQQAHIQFITGAIQYIILAVCLIFWFLICKFCYKKLIESKEEIKALNKKEYMYRSALNIEEIGGKLIKTEIYGYILTPIFSLGLMIVYSLYIPSISALATMILNPDYWALQELIKMVKVVGS